MFRKIGAAIYRGLFWTYERGTWQYDIMVALILAFIFLSPRSWFSDQPKSAVAGVMLLSASDHERVYKLQATLISDGSDGAEEAIRSGAERILQSYVGKAVEITQITPETDARGHVISYAVSVRE
jgi:hypothetical protein